MKCNCIRHLRNVLLEGSVRIVSRLPFRVLYAISDITYYFVYYVGRYRRDVVRKNIDSAFSERTEQERRDIEHKFYHFFCDYAVETVKLLTIGRKKIMRHMTFEGVEEMEEQLKTHPFVFVFLGHFGNWEWISTLPLHVHEPNKCAQLYRPLSDVAFDHLFGDLRTRFGAINISKYDTLRRIVQMKRDGQRTIVGFISDQSPRPQSIHDWVDFLHHKTPVFTGAERIGKKMNAAVFYANVTRPRRGYYNCKMELMSDHISDVPDFQLTEQYMVRLAESIQQNPQMWLWSHKRWKHEDLYAEMMQQKAEE